MTKDQAGGAGRAIRGHAAPVQGDSERLPFPPDAFDAVTCAVEVQAAMASRNADESVDRRLDLRTGPAQKSTRCTGPTTSWTGARAST